jgi:hypothetical protein
MYTWVATMMVKTRSWATKLLNKVPYPKDLLHECW